VFVVLILLVVVARLVRVRVPKDLTNVRAKVNVNAKILMLIASVRELIAVALDLEKLVGAALMQLNRVLIE
jgi:hypothetical protein